MNFKLTIEKTDHTGHIETEVYYVTENELNKRVSEVREKGFITLFIEQIKQVYSEPEIIYVAVKKEGNQIFFNHIDAQICSKEVLIYEKKDWLSYEG
jgi:uncharacterized protein YfcZ (UPF0381/DUF406 family)